MSTEGIPRFSKQEMARRKAAADALCNESKVDALLIFGHSGSRRHYQADVHYLTEVAPFHECYLLAQPGHGATLWITHHNHFASARETASIDDVRRMSRDRVTELVAEMQARKLDKASIGLVGSFFYKELDELRATFPGVTWTDLSFPYKMLRVFKSEEELAFQRKAAAGCDAVIDAIRREIRPGVEERDLMVLSESVAWRDGCSPNFLYLNSTPMDASESCVPNQNISRRKLLAGDVINTELTVSYGMYSAQVLRPFFLGEPNALYKRIYAETRRIHDKLEQAMAPGVSLEALYDICSEIKQQDFTSVDGFMHGFGVDILPPSISGKFLRPMAGRSLAKNYTMVLQPNITTLDEKAGMQIGEMVVITDAGFVSMHQSPPDAFHCY